jgi:exodeoxyribonuclease V gamma subunit
MKTLRLYTGNRLEILAKELAEMLKTPLASPFNKETILVQSRGMERWLSMQLAEGLGACANIEFPFPNAFIYDIFRSTLPPLPEKSPYDPQFSTWKILEILTSMLDRPGLEPIRNYLREPGYTLKGLQLSLRIAETFNQYVIYRPELVAAWDAGDEDHWQAILWREISKGREQEHRAALRDQLLRKLDTADPDDFTLPRRVTLFGISYLPPYHMQILRALSRLTEVHLFLLSPCLKYWGDLAGRKEMRGFAFSEASRGLSAEELHIEQGNSLLASMGMLGRDFFELLLAMNCEDSDYFVNPGADSLLSCIQSDILNLEERVETSQNQKEISPDDKSIQIHSCHSPMREVEVLYDHLIEMFELNPDLLPKDILVMAPDIESYAPFVQAVFDASDPAMRIPYGIADRSMRRKNRIAATLLAILDLWGERLSAPQVFPILESLSVQARFNLTESDFEVIAGWVRDVRIRWGIDEEKRLLWSPVTFRENTWSAGIDRLLLGYAMPGREERLFQGILPFDNIEGSEAPILGGFLAFLDELFEFLSSLDHPKTLSGWSDHLLEALSRFFLTDEESELEMQSIKLLLADLKVIEDVSGFKGVVGLDLIKWYLARSLEQEGVGRGFITGGVTFCSMLPMRSIPFRALCLIGMNENAFPRQSKPPEFDLMAKKPRRGDRSIRNEDRYLFLEAIISAREKLVISYTGQSSQDNSIIPPSVLVSELMDYINGNFALKGSDRKDWFLTKHRLQPFNPAYFRENSGFFSYSREHLAEARCMMSKKREDPVFISGELPAPNEAFRTISIDDLVRFFANPAKFLLNRRLGIFLEKESSLLEEAECFELDGLERYQIQNELVTAALGDTKPEDHYALMKASGRLPHGTPGEFVFKDLSKGVDAFADQTEPYIRSQPLEPLEVHRDIAGFRVTGIIRPLFKDRLLKYRYADIKAKDHLRVWIPHLVLNCLCEPGYPKESMLIGLDDGEWHAVGYSPVEKSEEILARLLDLYWHGLLNPLHFFPASSFEYAEMVIRKQKPGEEAIEKAAYFWQGNLYKRGESEDPYLELCFRSMDPLDSDFERTAREVFEPLFRCIKEVAANG